MQFMKKYNELEEGYMDKLKQLISGENVDAVYINNKYQGESKSLRLEESKIEDYQCSIKIFTIDGENIEICFHSANDIVCFIEAYGLDKR